MREVHLYNSLYNSPNVARLPEPLKGQAKYSGCPPLKSSTMYCARHWNRLFLGCSDFTASRLRTKPHRGDSRLLMHASRWCKMAASTSRSSTARSYTSIGARLRNTRRASLARLNSAGLNCMIAGRSCVRCLVKIRCHFAPVVSVLQHLAPV